MIMVRARAWAVAAVVFGFAGSTAIAQSGVPFGPDLPQLIPPTIAAPDGYELFFRAHAVGTQNYACVSSANGIAWKQFAPQATLYQIFKNAVATQRATHFLSINPDEPGTARPTWQDSSDSSRIWARQDGDPAVVDAGAVPWLRLVVTGAEEGPAGGSFLTQAQYIQRLNTLGGTAPAGGCNQPSQLGLIALVPYSADYFFYRAPKGQNP